MFEQRMFPEAKDRLPEKIRERLPDNAVVVMLEPTDRPSDQRAQKFLYEGAGFDGLHHDKDGTLFMVNNKESVDAYAKEAGDASREALYAKPDQIGVKGETDTIQMTGPVTPQSLLEDEDDE